MDRLNNRMVPGIQIPQLIQQEISGRKGGKGQIDHKKYNLPEKKGIRVVYPGT